MNTAHRQRDSRIRFDWGLRGAAAIAEGADVAVVVDVLSFTTTLSVALDAGIDVLPYRWRDETAAAHAAAHDAVLAVGRRDATPGEVSLSPGTIRSVRNVERMVLPSPNGSSIAYDLDSRASTCLGASLRNSHAVAEWIARHHPTAVVAVVAAGEKWPDGSLRPAVEDLWGAGAVIAELVETFGPESLSPEADQARCAWVAVADRVAGALRDCASGRELAQIGFARDVEIASEVRSSDCVPVLIDHRFVDADSPSFADGS
ncbi:MULTISPECIES: 2-phosphosulfolactate phosphatase [unclassified Rhodococcus (in: high G+C Gram-positive bacteria)]|uniref:2-phosphosulfolactate phosphatase n=1 Tax=Rhodococcus sp. SJ-3 TaxID=3454628 RepID=UPI003F79DC65